MFHNIFCGRGLVNLIEEYEFNINSHISFQYPDTMQKNLITTWREKNMIISSTYSRLNIRYTSWVRLWKNAFLTPSYSWGFIWMVMNNVTNFDNFIYLFSHWPARYLLLVEALSGSVKGDWFGNERNTFFPKKVFLMSDFKWYFPEILSKCFLPLNISPLTQEYILYIQKNSAKT